MARINISIDRNAHIILHDIGLILEDNGEPHTHSDAIRSLARSPIHLCNTCEEDSMKCDAVRRFRDGKRNNEVYACDEYVHKQTTTPHKANTTNFNFEGTKG